MRRLSSFDVDKHARRNVYVKKVIRISRNVLERGLDLYVGGKTRSIRSSPSSVSLPPRRTLSSLLSPVDLFSFSLDTTFHRRKGGGPRLKFQPNTLFTADSAVKKQARAPSSAGLQREIKTARAIGPRTVSSLSIDLLLDLSLSLSFSLPFLSLSFQTCCKRETERKSEGE
jgi:hypothetical protein